MVRQVTPRQLELLLEFLEEHQSLALGKVRGREGNALSKRLWRQCAEILNADAGGLSKSGPEWKKYYNQFKSRTKAKLRLIKQGRTRTGGGPALQQSLFPLEERLISIVGGCSSPLPVRQNPLDDPSFEPASGSSGAQLTDEVIIVPQDADLPLFTPIASQIETECFEVLSDDAGSHSENGVEKRSLEPIRDINPPKRRRCHRRRSSSSKANKELEAAQQRLVLMEQSRIEVDKELVRALNRHASAMEEIAGAVKLFVGLYEETVRRGRGRRTSNSSNSSSIRIDE